MALTPAAKADMIVTSTFVLRIAPFNYNLDVNNEGEPDFTIHATVMGTFPFVISAGKVVVSAYGPFPSPSGVVAAALQPGDPIGSKLNFIAFGALASGANTISGRFRKGDWNGVSAYLGLKFDIDGQARVGGFERGSMLRLRSRANAVRLQHRRRTANLGGRGYWGRFHSRAGYAGPAGAGVARPRFLAAEETSNQQLTAHPSNGPILWRPLGP